MGHVVQEIPAIVPCHSIYLKILIEQLLCKGTDISFLVSVSLLPSLGNVDICSSPLGI